VNTDIENRCAAVRNLWAGFEARDWPAARQLLTDSATLHWPVTGEWLLDADAIIKVNAIYPEGWSIDVQAVDALADGRVHSLVIVTHGTQRFFAHSRFSFDEQGLIAAVVEHWAMAEAPPAWRTAEAIGAYRREQQEPST
jgi:hypothetical protein